MTNMTVRVNVVDADDSYQDEPTNYIGLNLTSDYLIWSGGSDDVKDKMTHEPTALELNAAAEAISETVDVTVSECFVMDYSHDFGGAYYTHEVKGMGENKKFVFGFSFDDETASEPTLEAWDDSDHDSTDLHVLGAGTPADSMVKAVCTTTSLPGASWAGTAIAGRTAGRYIKLNDENGALGPLGSGIDSQELYANIKIVIPTNYATPAAETFVLTCRYSWN
jgi:hypothetical protein